MDLALVQKILGFLVSDRKPSFLWAANMWSGVNIQACLLFGLEMGLKNWKSKKTEMNTKPKEKKTERKKKKNWNWSKETELNRNLLVQFWFWWFENRTEPI